VELLGLDGRKCQCSENDEWHLNGVVSNAQSPYWHSKGVNRHSSAGLFGPSSNANDIFNASMAFG
jgi:hypothetical protein